MNDHESIIEKGGFLGEKVLSPPGFVKNDADTLLSLLRTHDKRKGAKWRIKAIRHQRSFDGLFRYFINARDYGANPWFFTCSATAASPFTWSES